MFRNKCVTRERLLTRADMLQDRYFLFTVIVGILSKCLILTSGNITIQNRDSLISKMIKSWQNIKFGFQMYKISQSFLLFQNKIPQFLK